MSEEDELINDDIREKVVKFKEVEESDDEMEIDEEGGDKGLFLNPLLVQKGVKQNKNGDDKMSDGEWSEDEDDKKVV